MFMARVVGNVEARIRLPGFESQKLLVLQPVDFKGNPIRWTTIALDITGAGVGSLVAYVEGREAANPFEEQSLPVDACVVAIVDEVRYHPPA